MKKMSKRQKNTFIILLVIFIFMLFFAVTALPDIIKSERREREAYTYFGEVCGFVKENEDIFIELSEFQCSLSSDVNDIAAVGDMQAERDIVFKYFDFGSTGIDGGGNVSATYSGHCGSSYEITLMLSENIGKERKDHEAGKVINDDMYLFMLRTRW